MTVLTTTAQKFFSRTYTERNTIDGSRVSFHLSHIYWTVCLDIFYAIFHTQNFTLFSKTVSKNQSLRSFWFWNFLWKGFVFFNTDKTNLLENPCLSLAVSVSLSRVLCLAFLLMTPSLKLFISTSLRSNEDFIKVLLIVLGTVYESKKRSDFVSFSCHFNWPTNVQQCSKSEVSWKHSLPYVSKREC